MLGDQIQIRSDYFSTSSALCKHLLSHAKWHANKMVIGIAGESGSGKSVTAVCMQKTLADYNRRALIVHQDDYFVLPPASNHVKRQQDLSWVGPQEVRLDLISHTIAQFMSNAPTIEVPLVHYQANEILSEVVQLSGYDLLIVEGTYSLMLPNLDYTIFMDRTYIETRAQRLRRGREMQTAFIEAVLEIEHRIVREQRASAQVIVDKNYELFIPTSVK
jgi:uridine kinase